MKRLELVEMEEINGGGCGADVAAGAAAGLVLGTTFGIIGGALSGGGLSKSCKH